MKPSRVTRRFVLSTLAALPLLHARPWRTNAQAQAADPLPSWNDGRAKQAILDFVAAVTTEGSARFRPRA